MKTSEKIAIIIGTLLFIIFVTGLAWSISTGLAGFVRSIPFWIIVIFCTIWTYCGMPSINLPLLQGKNKLPIGIQLVSSIYDDERLFRNSTWLTDKIK